MPAEQKENPAHGLKVGVETLKPGDVVVVVWHDASEWRDCSTFYSPKDVGLLGIGRLSIGMVVTNGDGWLRIAENLTYPREGEIKNIVVKNTYHEIPWSWLDKIFLCGSFGELLLDLWEKAGV